MAHLDNVQLGELEIGAWFGIFKKLAVNLFQETKFIDRSIKRSILMEQSTFAFQASSEAIVSNQILTMNVLQK